MSEKFAGGRNIVIKAPPHQYDATVQSFRDVIGLKPLSRAEIWFEFVVDDVPAASKYLGMNEIIQRNEIEPLPEGFDGFWISNPASIIHLVSKRTHS